MRMAAPISNVMAGFGSVRDATRKVGRVNEGVCWLVGRAEEAGASTCGCGGRGLG